MYGHWGSISIRDRVSSFISGDSCRITSSRSLAFIALRRAIHVSTSVFSRRRAIPMDAFPASRDADVPFPGTGGIVLLASFSMPAMILCRSVSTACW